MLDGGDVACSMEVSSHALELHRADAIHFAAAIFTNLTQDHLDFHGTMEEYFQAKRRLFVEAGPRSRGRQHRRRVRRATGGRAARAGDVRASSATPTIAAEQLAHRPGRVALHGPRTGRRRSSCARRCPGASTSTTCSARSPPPARSGVPLDTAAARDRDRRVTCPAASSRWTPARSSRCWSTTRTPRTRSRTCCGPRAAWSPTLCRAERARPRRVRLRRGPRPRQAAADGRDRRSRWPTG